jgi:hypothetical protein
MQKFLEPGSSLFSSRFRLAPRSKIISRRFSSICRREAAPRHSAGLSVQCLKYNEPAAVPALTCSPDLNPMARYALAVTFRSQDPFLLRRSPPVASGSYEP